MTTLTRRGMFFTAVAALAVGLPGVRGASMYLSVVAETFAPEAASVTPGQSKSVTYTAVDGGYVESGNPVGGVVPASPAQVSAALTQALSGRGYQPAPAGTTPALLIVYNWGEIRHDSNQIAPPDHLRGNDRARLLLVTRTDEGKRIEQSLVTDRYFDLKVGAMTRTEPERNAIELARDDLFFVVVSAYDFASVRNHQAKLLWREKLTTRAIGHPMDEALTTLIASGAPFLGHDEARRQDLKVNVVPPATASGSAPSSPRSGEEASLVSDLAKTEHDEWSGTFRHD